MLVSVLKKELEDVEHELDAQTDRGAAIIGCAILDDFLTAAIKERLIVNSKILDRLFNYEKNGPLAHFAAKIDIAISIGIITTDMWADLHTIRRIRNEFAHRANAIKFSDTTISRLCSELLTAKGSIKNPRKRYLYVCSGMSAVFAAFKTTDIKIAHIYSDPKIEREHKEQFAKIFDRYIEAFDARHKA